MRLITQITKHFTLEAQKKLLIPMKIYQDPDPAGFRQAEFRISGFSKNQIPDNRISVKIRISGTALIIGLI